MNILKWLILAPLTVLVVAFAIANRAPVAVHLDPLPFGPIALPGYAVLFAGVFIGLLVGGLVAWWRGGRWRRQARQQTRAVRTLEHELAARRRQGAEPGDDGTPLANALPPPIAR